MFSTLPILDVAEVSPVPIAQSDPTILQLGWLPAAWGVAGILGGHRSTKYRATNRPTRLTEIHTGDSTHHHDQSM